MSVNLPDLNDAGRTTTPSNPTPSSSTRADEVDDSSMSTSSTVPTGTTTTTQTRTTTPPSSSSDTLTRTTVTSSTTLPSSSESSREDRQSSESSADSSSATTKASSSESPEPSSSQSSSEATSSSESETSSTRTTSSSSSSETKEADKPTHTSDADPAHSKAAASSDKPPTLPAKKDDGKLSTGTIIGISLGAFIVAGILVACLGSFLKWRRKKMIEKKTAHLKRASDIWDFADSAGANENQIEASNEKAATDIGGAVVPFARKHDRQQSAGSVQSGVGSVHSAAPSTIRSDFGGPRPLVNAMPPPFRPPPNMMQGQGGWANRISRAFMPARPPPQPALPMHSGLIGQSSIHEGNDYFGNVHAVPPAQDSFGARVHGQPRNAFFPPSPPQSHLGVSPGASLGQHPLGVSPAGTIPLALPGSRQ